MDQGLVGLLGRTALLYTTCLEEVLLGLVAVHPVLQLRGREAEAADPGFGGAAVGPGCGDGVPHAPVGQPAGVAPVQAGEPPGHVELAHPGHLRAVALTRLPGLRQVHPAGPMEEEDLAWRRRRPC